MRNATVGPHRALARLRPTHMDRVTDPVRFHPRTIRVVGDIRVRSASLVTYADPPGPLPVLPPRRLHLSVLARLGIDTAVPVVVALILTAGSVASWLPGVPAWGAVGESGPGVGDTDGGGSAPRIAVGGGVAGIEGLPPIGRDELEPVRLPSRVGAGVALRATRAHRLEGADYTAIDPDAPIVAASPASDAGGPRSFLDDGTLLKPTAVSTTVVDGKRLLRSYTVRAGEDVTDVAKKFGLSPRTVEWANRLNGPGLRSGQALVIPPVDGVVIVTREGDTLDSLARTYHVKTDTIVTTNGLEDDVLVAGQTLVVPGASPPRPPDPKARDGNGPAARGSKDGKGGPAVHVPRTYVGGPMTWPVVGGNNFVSQPFHGHHYGLDIAADYGARVTASAAGVVTYAGWKSNGGGYQVWIAHGSGLFTTYNHMSAVSVGVGQAVRKGQQVGRIGMSGRATGPHLHFEVWRGPIWDGGTRVNPLSFVKDRR